MEEVWKAVVGYEGLYEVSSLGRVRSLDRICGHRHGGQRMVRGGIKKLSTGTHGYHIVRLTARSKQQETVCVHRLVAGAFIPNPDALRDVNHKDLDYKNNRVENLEWVSHRRNIEHARDGGRLHGFTNTKRRFKLEPDQVFDIRARLAIGETQESIAARHGVHRRTVGMIGKGQRWNPAFAERATS